MYLIWLVAPANSPTSVPEPQQLPVTLPPTNRSTESQVLTESAANVMSSEWAESFTVPWTKMTAKLQKTIAQKKRVEPSEKRAMVRLIVDEMRLFDPNPRREHVNIIARKIVQSHPATFEDRTDEGERLGCGYHSLSQKLKTRIDHINRNNTFVRLRRARKSRHPGNENIPPDTSSSHSALSSRPQPCDSYGCVNWQPTENPDGLTDAALDEKKKKLTDIFQSAGPIPPNINEVDELMNVTFVCQRRTINSCPVQTVREEWPYLFTTRWMCKHFQLLVGFDIITRTHEAMQKKGGRIIKFMEANPTKATVRSVLNNYHQTAQRSVADLSAVAAILLILAYFDEEESSMLLMSDVSNKFWNVFWRMVIIYHGPCFSCVSIYFRFLLDIILLSALSVDPNMT